jgi:uncharacterized protein (TIGR02453 family)
MDFPRLVRFLADLDQNNEKPWFEANRAEYQALRDQFTSLVGDVIAAIAEWDERVRWVDPKDCLYRIHRDVRFSGDKRPYKTTFSASIGERGKNTPGPGYYFHVDEKGTLLLGGGVYQPDPDRLARIREHVAAHPEKLRRVMRKRGFKETFGEIWGESLKRPPRGYSEETPLIGIIKLKSFLLIHERDVSAETADLRPFMAQTFRAMQPFMAWLADALAVEDEG